jgi:hypothetical protein
MRIVANAAVPGDVAVTEETCHPEVELRTAFPTEELINALAAVFQTMSAWNVRGDAADLQETCAEYCVLGETGTSVPSPDKIEPITFPAAEEVILRL